MLAKHPLYHSDDGTLFPRWWQNLVSIVILHINIVNLFDSLVHALYQKQFEAMKYNTQLTFLYQSEEMTL